MKNGAELYFTSSLSTSIAARLVRLNKKLNQFAVGTSRRKMLAYYYYYYPSFLSFAGQHHKWF